MKATRLRIKVFIGRRHCGWYTAFRLWDRQPVAQARDKRALRRGLRGSGKYRTMN